MNNKLYVGNLSSNTTENQLKDTFAVHGTVTETNVVTDRTTGQSRGFGFVTMSSPEEANHAIEALNGTSIDGSFITVNVARPPAGKPSNGGSRAKAV
jgi:RNA recognition motif-containing protein